MGSGLVGWFFGGGRNGGSLRREERGREGRGAGWDRRQWEGMDGEQGM